MVKRSKDEPDNKAAERLKQFMDARRPVPDTGQEDQTAEQKQLPAETQEGKGNSVPDNNSDPASSQNNTSQNNK